MGIPIIGDLINGVKDIIGQAVVDKDKKIEIDYKLAELADQAQARLDAQTQGQIEVNKVEAANGSIFVAGWRPFVGWVCGVGLGTQSIVLPLIEQITGRAYHLDTTLLIATLGGMLGIGGMRTYEKVKGVSTNDYRDTPAAPMQKAPEAAKPQEPVSAGASQIANKKKKFKIF